MLKIEYDVNARENEKAFKLFWRKYRLWRTVMLTLAFGISAFLFVDMILKGSGIFGWLGLALVSGFGVSLWLRPVQARKKMVASIENLAEEKYTAVFTGDYIEVETIIVAPEKEEVTEVVEAGETAETGEADNAEENQAPEPIPPTKINLGTEELFSVETDEMFALFVNRALIYIFPKRCLNEGEADRLRDYFDEKAI